MTVKTPNIEKLQEFLNETREDSFLLNQVKSTLENIETIKNSFFNNDAYLPLLEEARKKGQITFNTLVKQVEKQCDLQSSTHVPKIKPQ